MIEIAGVEVMALRVSFTGDLGWELHCRAADQATLYAALLEVGTKRWARSPLGSRALMSLRMEKGLRIVGSRIQPGILAAGMRAGPVVPNRQTLPEPRRGASENMAKSAREHMVLLALNAEDTDASQRRRHRR